MRIKSSGTDAAPIRFGAYGSGPAPEISGADVVDGWIAEGDNVYKAACAAEPGAVFVDGVKQTLARWPNSGWATIDKTTTEERRTAKSLYSDALTQPDDYWAGATAVIHTANWSIEAKRIAASSQADHAISLDRPVYRWIKKGFGFYIEGNRSEIDRVGEWAYQDGKLYLKTAGGGPTNVEAATRDYGIEIRANQHHVTIDGLAVTRTKSNGIWGRRVDDIAIENTAVSFTGG